MPCNSVTDDTNFNYVRDSGTESMRATETFPRFINDSDVEQNDRWAPLRSGAVSWHEKIPTRLRYKRERKCGIFDGVWNRKTYHCGELSHDEVPTLVKSRIARGRLFSRIAKPLDPSTPVMSHFLGKAFAANSLSPLALLLSNHGRTSGLRLYFIGNLA